MACRDDGWELPAKEINPLLEEIQSAQIQTLEASVDLLGRLKKTEI